MYLTCFSNKLRVLSTSLYLNFTQALTFTVQEKSLLENRMQNLFPKVFRHILKSLLCYYARIFPVDLYKNSYLLKK